MAARGCAWLLAALLALAAARLASSQVVLDAEQCRSIISRRPLRIEEMEKTTCQLCQTIYRNRVMWDWVRFPDALLTGVPHVFMQQAKFIACKLLQCEEFRTARCSVPTGAVSSGAATTPTATPASFLSPCPSRYVCFSCLRGVLNRQFQGCLDHVTDEL